MSLITLNEINTAWQNLSNWVKGIDTVSSPKVTVSTPLPMGDNNIGKIGIDQTNNGISINGSSTMVGAIKLVTTAGVRVQLPNIPCQMVTIIAKRTNIGYIYAGDNTVSDTIFGVELGAKDSFDFQVSNANLIWINASISGEGISYVAI